jgi:hypothetical protein
VCNRGGTSTEPTGVWWTRVRGAPGIITAMDTAWATTVGAIIGVLVAGFYQGRRERSLRLREDRRTAYFAFVEALEEYGLTHERPDRHEREDAALERRLYLASGPLALVGSTATRTTVDAITEALLANEGDALSLKGRSFPRGPVPGRSQEGFEGALVVPWVSAPRNEEWSPHGAQPSRGDHPGSGRGPG